MKQFISCLCDICVPGQCVICGVLIRTVQHGICESCRTNIATRRFSPLADDPYCVHIDRALSFLVYDDAVKQVILSYKDRPVKQLALHFVNGMSSLVPSLGIVPDTVTFVPMTAAKRRKRGFNQAEHLARAIAVRNSIPCRSLLVRSYSGVDQKRLNRSQRRDNVRDLFHVNTRETVGGTVLVVDDVMTTGATLNECAYVLKKNGAKHVFSLTIGRV
ncbi:MAG: ComF family protein, partial [Spirochaetota bacterium]